jgi:hypothetical protein
MARAQAGRVSSDLTERESFRDVLLICKQRTPIPDFYQVLTGSGDYEKDGIRVIPVHKFLAELKMK